MCKTIKITKKDKFIWRLLTNEQAIDFLQSNVDSLYALYDDEEETAFLVSDLDELTEMINAGNVEFGIEVGFVYYKEREELVELLKHHDFQYSRADDYSAYIVGKAEYDAINSYKSCIPQEVYVDLWNKYAPVGFKIKEIN